MDREIRWGMETHVRIGVLVWLRQNHPLVAAELVRELACSRTVLGMVSKTHPQLLEEVRGEAVRLLEGRPEDPEVATGCPPNRRRAAPPFVAGSLALLVLVTACATVARGAGGLPPGYGVTDDAAESACGSVAAFRELADGYMAEFRARHAILVPPVGASLCDVFARLGRPHRVETVQAEGAPERLMLWYQTGAVVGSTSTLEMHLVEVEPGSDGRGRVVAVVW